MKIFLSALENDGYYTPWCWLHNLDKLPFRLKWNLMSYYYIRGIGKKEQRSFVIIASLS